MDIFTEMFAMDIWGKSGYDVLRGSIVFGSVELRREFMTNNEYILYLKMYSPDNIFTSLLCVYVTTAGLSTYFQSQSFSCCTIDSLSR